MDQPDGIPGGQGGRTVDRARVRAGARRWGLFGAGVAAAFVAVAVYGVVTQGPPPLTDKDVQAGIEKALASMTPPPARSQLVYDQVRPSLVLIQVTGLPGSSASPSAAPGASPGPGGIGAGLGTGVIVSQSGDILTSLHVVKGASSIEVTFADGTTSSATIASSDPDNDIAVLSPATLPATVVPAILGNPNAVKIGNEAYVVGNPFGLYASLSAGVVSGLDRTIQPRLGRSGGRKEHQPARHLYVGNSHFDIARHFRQGGCPRFAGDRQSLDGARGDEAHHARNGSMVN